jgi:hypothetical protein
MDVVNDVIQNLKDLDNDKFQTVLPEPCIMFKKVSKF